MESYTTMTNVVLHVILVMYQMAVALGPARVMELGMALRQSA